MKIVLIFLLFLIANSMTDLRHMKDISNFKTLNNNQLFETMTHDSGDNSNIIIFSDEKFYYVRKISKTLEKLWETKIGKGGERNSVSISFDSERSSIYISGNFNQDEKNVVVVMKLDSKDGKVRWTENLGEGFQNGNTSIVFNGNSVFTIKNRVNDEEEIIKMHLYKLDSEEGFVIKKDIEEGIFEWEYYQYESLIVNSNENLIFVIKSYYDNYGGIDTLIKKFDKDLKNKNKTEGKFINSISYKSKMQIIFNKHDNSIYYGYDEENVIKNSNQLLKLNSNLQKTKNIEFDEDHLHKDYKLNSITINPNDGNVVYISTYIVKTYIDDRIASTSFQFFLNILNTNGEVLLKKQIYLEEESKPTAVVVNNDGSVLIAGNSIKESNFEERKGKGYLIKIDGLNL